MKNGNGFITIEMTIALALVGLIGCAAAATIFQTLHVSQATDKRLTVIEQVRNASYWLSRDAAMADDVIADNLTSPTFLILKWTDWGTGESNIYYSATYSIVNVTNGVGQLKRRYQDSNGTDKTALIANYIYYNPADPANSTAASYQNPKIDLKVVSQFNGATETKDYTVYRRPNF